MKLPRRKFLHLAGGAAALPALSRIARAQAYPSQNVKIVVAFAAGGIADVIARLVGQKLTERLGQTVVIENRGGAGGNIGTRVVASAMADGYTLLATTSALAVNETASRNKGYTTEDLRAVAIIAISPDVIAIHPSNPAQDLKQFVTNNKGKTFTFGSAGVGTAPHIGAEYFFREIAKLNPVHVPFTGGAPAVTAAIGNHIDALVLTLPTVAPQIASGGLRGIGLASPTRNEAVPAVPTYGEMGWPNIYSGSWVGFFAPARTPDEVIVKLNAEINSLMREPDAQQKLKTIGFDPIFKNPVATTDYFKSEVAAWTTMVKAVGITVD